MVQSKCNWLPICYDHSCIALKSGQQVDSFHFTRIGFCGNRFRISALSWCAIRPVPGVRGRLPFAEADPSLSQPQSRDKIQFRLSLVDLFHLIPCTNTPRKQSSHHHHQHGKGFQYRKVQGHPRWPENERLHEDHLQTGRIQKSCFRPEYIILPEFWWKDLHWAERFHFTTPG